MSVPRKHYARCRGVSLSVQPGISVEQTSNVEQVCDCEVIEAVLDDVVKAAASVFLESEKYLVGRSEAVVDAIYQSTPKEK